VALPGLLFVANGSSRSMATADPGRMNRCVGTPFLCLWLAGCLQIEETITIDQVGAGTQDFVMSAPQATLDAVRLAASVNQNGAASDTKVLFVRESMEQELTTRGLELVTHETTEDGTTKKVSMQAKFTSLSALRQSPLVGAAAEWHFGPGPAPDTIEVTLYPQGKKAWTDARIKAEQMKDAIDPVAADFFARRRAQLQGLDVTFRLRLPGKVLRYTANMDQTGDCEVTAKITADQICTPEDLVRRLAPRYQAVFDSRECKTFPIDR
jgi:hypothetical protein